MSFFQQKITNKLKALADWLCQGKKVSQNVAKKKQEKTYHSAFFSYEAIKQIGCGGNGVVVKVKRKEDGKYFAIKILHETNNEKISRFKNEYGALLSINHPNIIRPIDNGIQDGKLFYVMPLASSTLRALMDDDLQKEKQTGFMRDGDLYNSIAIKLISALSCLHKNGIIHRDLKPENILLFNKEPMICDLGIANINSDIQVDHVKTSKDSRMANFKYAAPEQRSKNPIPRPTMDIYSLGIIINELFTGDFIQSNKIKTIEDVFPEYGYWDKIVDKCIYNQPERRFSSAIQLKNDFDQYKWDISFPIKDQRTESTHFYFDRFLKAFSQDREEYDNIESIFPRLKELLRPPYRWNGFDCIWWSRGTEFNSINGFLLNEKKGIAYIGDFECSIKRIVSLPSLLDYNCCVYVETNPLPPLFTTTKEADRESFTLYRDKEYPCSLSENGCYWEGNHLIKTDEPLIEYLRFLKPYNFLILSRMNSVVQASGIDNITKELLDKILINEKTIDDLASFINKLPKPRFYP